jgi:hypothetical protein
LVTEGVIHLNALICAVILMFTDHPRTVAEGPGNKWGQEPAGWGRLVAAGLLVALVAVVVDWAIVRGIYGDRFAGHAGLHIRFGPNATTSASRL